MNTQIDNLTTPRNIKRLGIRRSTKTITNSIEGAQVSAAPSRVGFQTTSPIIRLPQSDAKINYKHLAQSVSSTPITPKNTSSSDNQRMAVSTNCRPYRLSLSKKVREKMTKKRLEFYLANDAMEDTEEEPAEKFQTREDLLQLIEIARKELASRQEHTKKVQELKEAIEVWKAGFSSAIHDLAQKIEPRLEMSTLLQHLKISQEMLKYIND